jgi:hypothetical protein
MRGIFSRNMYFKETGCEILELIPLVENCADIAQRALDAGGGW